MTGWLILLGMTALVGGALWRFGRFAPEGVELLAAALLLAVAGYAWQGNPGMPGQPTPPSAIGARPRYDFALLRSTMFEGSDTQVLANADALQRQGRNRDAIDVLQSELERRPRSADLWVGLGNALVVHGNGSVTPAAELAFSRAAELSPSHPGPPFFLGLAYADAGQLAEARALWAGLLARSPMDAPWRADVMLRIRAVDARMTESTPER